MAENGFEVFLVTSEGIRLESLPDYINVYTVNMNRDINIKNDFISLMKLYRVIKTIKPDIINYGTPKASLLSSIASFFARIPIRIYTIHGLRLETLTGVRRFVLGFTERIAMVLSTNLLAISNSLASKAYELNLTTKKIDVLGHGSSNGLKSSFVKATTEYKHTTRERLDLPQHKFIIGYIGRMAKDKGLIELIRSFEEINQYCKNLHLVLVGSFDNTDPLNEETQNKILNDKNITYNKYVDDPIPYYNSLDLFVFPTHREGFGNVSIEAQAMEIPVVASNATGAKDTIENNRTGMLFEKGNIEDLKDKIRYIYENKEIRYNMGLKGHERVIKYFNSHYVWTNLYNHYLEAMNKSKNKKKFIKKIHEH